ncbi:Uncharacterized protein FKW44_010067 [Caligus rogercresseyi]|uniref:Uncharacterized protein n=1 Tax=Caligus rogercresseyi TaxID=217165 RepID=A0A7T8K734_CALRO|nr:Uncharacterized protein FKW44_010067 [Caligus rogercresseyi]
MSLECNVRIRIYALLEAWETPTEISRQLGIRRPTEYKVKATGIDWEVGYKAVSRLMQILMANLLKSIRAHAANMGVPHSTLALAVKNSGVKSLVRPLLTPALKESISNAAKLSSTTSKALGQGLVAPQSPNANPLDYAFWPHIEFKPCKLRHPNIAALKAADFVAKVCQAFRKRLMAIAAANSG